MEQHKDTLSSISKSATDGVWRSGGNWKGFLIVSLLLTVFLAGCSGKNNEKSSGEETALSGEMYIESIGGVYAFPVATGSEYQAPAGTDTAFLYAERENLEPGAGIFTLYDDGDDSILAQIPADSSQVVFGPVSEEQKIFYGMDGGTEIRISLGVELEAGKRYYVEVSEDFARYGDVGSHGFGGKGQWPIQIEG